MVLDHYGRYSFEYALILKCKTLIYECEQDWDAALKSELSALEIYRNLTGEASRQSVFSYGKLAEINYKRNNLHEYY